MSSISPLRIAWQALVALTLASFVPTAPAQGADPMKVGLSLALTGGVAANGKQILMALEFWRDDVNAKGGLLGRPVEIVYYDDQSNPSTVPALYTKLITADKVDLLLGPYATNMVAPAMPVIMQNNKTTILGNRHQPPLQLPEILLHGAGRAQGTGCVLGRLLRARGGAVAEAA